jgi:hypothetical protein
MEEVDTMVEAGQIDTKSQAFKELKDFYKSIGIDVKEETIERKYYRAQKLTNVSNEETATKTDSSEGAAKDEGAEREAPRCCCGKLCERKRRKDGTWYYYPECRGCRRKNTKKTEPVKTEEPPPAEYIESQVLAWEEAGRRIRSLCEYMEVNCRIDAKISKSLKSKIRSKIFFLKVYEDEFLSEGE